MKTILHFRLLHAPARFRPGPDGERMPEIPPIKFGRPAQQLPMPSCPGRKEDVASVQMRGLAARIGGPAATSREVCPFNTRSTSGST